MNYLRSIPLYELFELIDDCNTIGALEKAAMKKAAAN